MIDKTVKDEFVELRATGMSFAAIAEQLGVSKTTLIAWSKERQADISNLKQIHLESLRDSTVWESSIGWSYSQSS